MLSFLGVCRRHFETTATETEPISTELELTDAVLLFPEFTETRKRKETSEETSLYDGGEGGGAGNVTVPS